MSYIGNTSDVEQEKSVSDFRHNRSSNNLVAKNMGTSKISDVLWNHKRDDDSDSEISDSGNFLAKGTCVRICGRNLFKIIHRKCLHYYIKTCSSLVSFSLVINIYFRAQNLPCGALNLFKMFKF